MTIECYLGKQLKDYSYEDLLKLKRKQLLDLFYHLGAPDMAEMVGEYRAVLLDSGHILNRFLSWVFLYFTWGGWQHKAFEPLTDKSGHGYNTFITTEDKHYENYFVATFMKFLSILKSIFRLNNSQRVARIMLNKTSMVSSVFDDKPSFQLSYKEYNTFFTNTMTDEVRKVNDTLYLGMGRLSVTFGKYNPMPFVLFDTPGPWVGPDILYPDHDEICR